MSFCCRAVEDRLPLERVPHAGRGGGGATSLARVVVFGR